MPSRITILCACLFGYDNVFFTDAELSEKLYVLYRRDPNEYLTQFRKDAKSSQTLDAVVPIKIDRVSINDFQDLLADVKQ